MNLTTNSTQYATKHAAILLADIGGTNARFALKFANQDELSHIRSFPVSDYDTVHAAIQAYLDQAQQQSSQALTLSSAAFAVAAPIHNQCAKLTNGTWVVNAEELRQTLQLNDCMLLNDFEALALSLPHLRADQVRSTFPAITLRQKQAQTQAHTGTLLVLGPGTGMGVAALHPCAGKWYPIAGEGGHVNLAPSDDYENELLKIAHRHRNFICAEDFLSGTGLPFLYQCVCELENSPALALSCAEIIQLGLHHENTLCEKSLDVFCAMLGSYAGDLALIYGARSGVYIGGGIVPRLGEYFFNSRFREQFQNKGNFSAYLETIPSYVIQDGMAALYGCAYALEHGIQP
jgi:glucokinase